MIGWANCDTENDRIDKLRPRLIVQVNTDAQRLTGLAKRDTDTG